jgi:hypothetical protein
LDTSRRLTLAGTTVGYIRETEGDKYCLSYESSSKGRSGILSVCAKTRRNMNTTSNIIQINVLFVTAQRSPVFFLNCMYYILPELSAYFSGNQIEKNEMGWACSTYGGKERCIRDFGGET